MKASRYKANLDSMTKAETAAWAKIEQNFHSVKLVGPRKGFAGRWLQTQHQQEIAERRNRELWLALGNGTAILAILGVIVFAIWPVFGQPASLLATALDALLDGLTFMMVCVSLGLSMIETFSLLVWLAMATAFFCLIALWASLFSRVIVSNR